MNLTEVITQNCAAASEKDSNALNLNRIVKSDAMIPKLHLDDAEHCWTRRISLFSQKFPTQGVETHNLNPERAFFLYFLHFLYFYVLLLIYLPTTENEALADPSKTFVGSSRAIS